MSTLWNGDEHSGGGPIADALRSAWLDRRTVRVALSAHCDVPMIVGRVAHVSVTATVATIDGWHVPVDEILDVAAPTEEEADRYADLMMHLRRGDGSCAHCHDRGAAAAAWVDGCWRPPGACPRCGRVFAKPEGAKA